MDDDDEFGDLYTDVLRTFPSSTAADQPPPSSSPPSVTHQADLNLRSDDEEIPQGAPDLPSSSKLPDQTLASGTAPDSRAGHFDRNFSDAEEFSVKKEVKDEELAGNFDSNSPQRTEPRVLGRAEVKLETGLVDGADGGKLCNLYVPKDEGDDGGATLTEQYDNYDAEKADNGDGDAGLEPTIPGLSIQDRPAGGVDNEATAKFPPREDFSAEGDDWDSDSEDDLQIVLNDDAHGPMGMEGGVAGSDDEDEDGEPLVIVADDDPNHQHIEDQEWGEDAAQAADGEKKDAGEAAKANGGTAAAPKIGYSNHAYHPFHSQFKYVRPGAAPVPTATGAPGGGPGQVRPIGPIAGRGRGDWRPTGIKTPASMQKSFHSGYGLSWGNNLPGRGFGGGLDFTLPSHKTIFDVDIDGIEEKPWKLPGIDMSDYFNFGLNEESWKDYCKQLEQLRLESTMQSKIRVYESGRAEQEYDPDLPPELAAAAGLHDVTAENAISVKTGAGLVDVAKGSLRMRPPLPTGRAIQVESGYGERLPSIDTRAPRMRDSDAIIEIVLQGQIVLQGSVDDDSAAGNDVLEQAESDHRDKFSAGQDENACGDREYQDEFPYAHDSRKRELAGGREPFKNPACDTIPEADVVLPFASDAPSQYRPRQRDEASAYNAVDLDIRNEERQTKGRTRDKSEDEKFPEIQNEESVESMDGKHGPLSSSPTSTRVGGEQSDELKVNEQEEHNLAGGSSQIEMDDMAVDICNATSAENLHSLEKQKLTSQVEQSMIEVTDDAEDLKTTRSSENSKARSGSSKECRRRRDGTEEEVVQGQRSLRIGDKKRHLDEDESQRNDRSLKQENERHRTVKAKEESFSNSIHQPHIKTDALDRRKERDRSDGSLQKRDEIPPSRRIRPEDSKKRERGDEMGSRHRDKLRESERADKDELHSRKQMDNGSWRGHRDKDLGSRHRDRDNNLNRYDDGGDNRRRKDEEYQRRDHTVKEEILHGYRESANRRKRERDEVLDHRKRDDLSRIRENLDDHHAVRHKDDGWLQRDRSDWHRSRQSYEENVSRREREEVRGVVRSARGAEDKVWVHSRVKDEYSGSEKDCPMKDMGRHNEQLRRRDRIEDENIVQQRGREDAYARGSQFSSEDRRSRTERSSTLNDRENDHRVQEKRNRDNSRKGKESESEDRRILSRSKRNQENHVGHVTASDKGTSEQGNSKQDIILSSRKQRENASSDDEQQDSRRGRSKLERWTSHTERDYSISTKSSSSLKVKEIDRSNGGGSSFPSKLPHETPKIIESVDNQHTPTEERETADQEIKDSETKQLEDRHLDTVEKLKKRSERFKLPMPSEKEAMIIKKMENEPLSSTQSEVPEDSVIKQERPARKRRWISN